MPTHKSSHAIAKTAAGLAALAAAAGAYYFYGSPQAAKNRKTMKSWAVKAKGEVMEHLEEMKTMQKSIVDTDLRGPWQTQELVDKVSGRYWVRILYSADTVDKWVKERLQSENVLKKYFIEAQLKTVQDDLQKDLDSVRQKEAADRAKIAELTK